MENAAEALDAIRVGGDRMLLSANQRLIEVRAALDSGDFQRAVECGAQLMDRVQALAMASNRFGTLAKGHLVKIEALEPGMKTDQGTIVEIKGCPCGAPTCKKRRVVFEDGEELDLEDTWEIVISE